VASSFSPVVLLLTVARDGSARANALRRVEDKVRSKRALCAKSNSTLDQNRFEKAWLGFAHSSAIIKTSLRSEYRCAYCNNEILRAPYKTRSSTSGLIFCNQSCRASWTNQQRRGENHPNWKGAEATYRASMLREGPPPVCQRCGLTDLRVLTVHHLDENRSNNRLENLVWLCYNCHHLVHQYDDERTNLSASSAS